MLQESANPSACISGELFWVSAPMNGLVHRAAHATARNLCPHDLPTRTGFMIFEAPLAAYINGEGRQVQIVAVTWGLWEAPPRRGIRAGSG